MFSGFQLGPQGSKNRPMWASGSLVVLVVAAVDREAKTLHRKWTSQKAAMHPPIGK